MPRPIWTRKEISIACFLVLLTLVVYLPVFWLGFTNYDDPDYVTENFRISKGLTFSGIVWAFTAAHSGNWHPLTWISHMLDCQLFDLHAWGHHFSNLCFHLANIVLLFAWLRNFTGAVWRSAAVAALFALHPMHVESVAWVAERKDVMSGFFGLLSLYVYGLYAVANSNHSNVADVQRVMGLPKSGYYWLSLLIFIAGLMSKSMLVTWPFLMILLDLWPLQRLDLRERFSANRFVVMEKVPFLFCSFIVCLVTLATQHQARAMASLHDVSLLQRLLKIFPAYLAYLQKLLWPKDLAVIYPDPGSYPPATLLAGLAIFCAITFLVWSVRARKPFILMGWLWFVGTLVPVIGLVKVGNQSIADRYSYLPSIGFFIMCVWGVRELIRTRFSKIICSAAIAIIIFGWYAIQTPSQILLWMNTETLFRHALRVTQNNFVAYNSLAFYLADLGESRQAEQLLRVSLQINPLSAVAWNKLGSVLIKRGDNSGAILQCQRALQLDPALPDAHTTLALALLKSGDTKGASEHYLQALSLSPNYAPAHYNLANLLVREGKLEDAAQHYQAALRFDPNSFDTHNNLGYVLVALGKFSEAVAEFQAALEIDPASWRALYGLADALAKLGQFEFSANILMRLIQLKPELAIAHYQLGSVLARENRIAEALQALNNAVNTGEKTGDAVTARKSRELIEKLSQTSKPPTATVPAPQ